MINFLFFILLSVNINENQINCNYDNIIQKYKYTYSYQVEGKNYYINNALVKAVILQESQGDPEAVSSAGAIGLMQLMPQTAELLGADIKRLKEPEYNIRYGMLFLAALLTEHKGDLVKVLSSYNGGSFSTSTKSVGGDFKGRIYDNPETRSYVRKVLGNYEEFKKNNKCMIPQKSKKEKTNAENH